MGASNSKIEEDNALQLCRVRKKFIREALDGRCSLAATHVAYVQSLKIVGTALRKFVEPEGPMDSSLYTSTSAIPEPLVLIEKSLSHFSYPSPSVSQRMEGTEHYSPSPSPPNSSRYQAHHMKFTGLFSRKVEEKPPVPVTGSVTSSVNTQSNIIPQSAERPEPPPSEQPRPETPTTPSESETPWDYFGLFHPIDTHFSAQEVRGSNQGFENVSQEVRGSNHGFEDVLQEVRGSNHGFENVLQEVRGSNQGFENVLQEVRGSNQGLENVDNVRRLREEEGIPDLEDAEEKGSPERGESQVSEDEFDEPSTDTLVRSFENVNRVLDQGAAPTSSADIPSAESVELEAEPLNRGKSNSPHLSPLRPTASPGVTVSDGVKRSAMKEDGVPVPRKITPKNFFSSVKEIEHLFIKASESGKEVPRMLEANKFHFRPVLPEKERGSTFLKACFSCGDDPSQIQEEPAQASVKYLTWHRTTSSRSSSSRNPLGANSRDDIEDLTNSLFDSFSTISGGHASTLDRLYAWERKLYDEVKASKLVRKKYDMECRFLRQLESKGESPSKIDKTRAIVKDLHSRIRVAVHRIDTISKKVEELRDQELQPQLEELIEGLRRMWDVMFECHKLQFQTISDAYDNGHFKISLRSESRRHIAIHLEHVLTSLSLSFTKWIGAQEFYIKAINDWLMKCVSLPQQSSKRKRRMPAPSIRNFGPPPIYVTCSLWLEMLGALPSKNVAESIKGLASEVSHFLPRQEKNQGKGNKNSHSASFGEMNMNLLRDETLEDGDWMMGFDRFKTSLVGFLGQLNNFAEASVKMFSDLESAIALSKNNYYHFRPRT